jgi:membrane fusion protein
MSEQLFRPEVLKGRNSHSLGSVLIHQPLSYTLAALITSILIALVMAYAYHGTYTRKATVRGLLMPEQGLFRLVAPSNGQISVVDIREGQEVKAGQPLFKFVNAQVTRLGPTHALVREQLQHRLTLMQASADFSTARQGRELELIKQRLDAMDAESAQLERELALIMQREKLAETQHERIRKQAEIGFVSQSQLEQSESELLAIRQQKHSTQRSCATLERDRGAVQAAEEDIKARHQAQLTEAENALAALRQELAELEAQRESISIAPFAGTVTGVHVHEGSIIASGTLLASIIPDTAKLVAYLYAPEKSSGFLEIGQPVRIRFAAYPYQKYGMASGTVVNITQSPYALTELPPHVATAIQSETGSQTLYYRITTKLTKQGFDAIGKENPLRAGMLLEADIVQDTRRLYEWALEPIYSVTGKFINDAF